jgi:hypothetical protein
MLQNFLDQFRERKSATSNEHRGELERAITRLRETLGPLRVRLAGLRRRARGVRACSSAVRDEAGALV